MSGAGVFTAGRRRSMPLREADVREGGRRRRALVAGGAGFIGGNLCSALLTRGYDVWCIDNLITGRAETASRLAANTHCRFIEGDVADPRLAAHLLRTRYDDVYDLACPTGVPNIALLGEEMLLTSSLGSLHLLTIAQRCGARYLFASSAEIYGEAELVPQPETYNGNVDPIGPRSAYEEGKRFGEALTALYSSRYGLDTRIVRIFNTYGPGMSMTDQRVIPQMVASAIDGSPFTIFGDGTQTRSFLYVDDLIEGFFVALDNGKTGDVFNIGSPHERSILDLLGEATLAFGREIRFEHRAPFIRDHLRRCPNTRKIEELGWSPKVSLRDGLRRSLDAAIGRAESGADAPAHGADGGDPSGMTGLGHQPSPALRPTG